MSKVKILLVEDEADVAKFIRDILEDQGYSVPDVIAYGEEAIEKAGETCPDLVLMDIILKGAMDGIEVAKQIHDRFNIPVIYLTGYADEKKLQTAKLTEPYGYILKPFNAQELHATIEMAIYKYKMETELKSRYSTTLRCIGDAVITIDKKGFITFMNPVAEAQTGWKQEVAQCKALTEVFDVKDKNKIISIKSSSMKSLFKGDIDNISGDSILVNKEKTDIPVEFNIAPIRDDKEIITGFILVFHDITERLSAEQAGKQAEKALLESEEKYRTIFDNIYYQIVYVNKYGTITAANDMEKIFGRKPEEIIGKNFTKLGYFNVKDIPKMLNLFKDVITGRKKIDMLEMEIKHKDGHKIPVEISTRLVKKGGRIDGFLCMVRDITKCKKAEEKIKEKSIELEKQFNKSEKQKITNLVILNDLNKTTKDLKSEINERKRAENETRKMHQSLFEAHEKLQQAYREEKKLRDKLIQSEKLASLGQMGAKIAHEINNPLTVIYGRAYMWQMEKIDKKLKKTFDLIVKESLRIKNITSTYINLSRPTPARRDRLNLNEVIEECVDTLVTTGEIKYFKVEKILQSDIPVVIGDRERLIQVFRNLIANAIHAMADNEVKSLTFRSSVSKDKRFVKVSIKDTGYGIAKKDFNKIFDIYYTTKPEGLGTGLGLVIVKDIIEKQHKGKVLVESEVSKGTTFTIQLPIERKTKRKILIVDDEAFTRELFTDYFERKGLDVFKAQNGEEALQYYKSIQPDIILADIQMPVMDGFEFAEKVRAKNPKQKIIFMTGYYFEHDIQSKLEKSNIRYFTKPADFDVVWEMISKELKSETP